MDNKPPSKPEAKPHAASGAGGLISQPGAGWLILDSLPYPIIVLSASFEVEYINQAARLTLGAHGDLSGVHCHELIRGSDGPCSVDTCPCAQLKENSHAIPFSIVHRVVDSHGNEVFRTVTATPLLDEAGNLTHIVQAYHDITDHIKFEHSMRHVLAGISSTTGVKFFNRLATALGQVLGMGEVIIGRLLPGKQAVETVAASRDEEILAPFSYPLAGAPCQETVSGKTVIVENGAWKKYPGDDYLVERKLESYLGTPLVGSNGGVIGLLVAVGHRPLANPQTLRSIITTFAARAAAEMERMDAEEELQKAREQLEHKVELRTAELRESEQRNRLLFNSGDDAVMVHGVVRRDGGMLLPGNFIEVNDVAVKRYGYSRTEMLAMSPMVLDARIDKVNPPDIMGTLLERGRIVFESAHRCKDGREVLVEIAAQAFELRGETVIMSIVRDISDRVHVQEALRASESRFRTLMEHASDALFVFNLDGQLKIVNKEACDSLGYSEEELLKLTVADVDNGFPPGKIRDYLESFLPGQQLVVNAHHRRVDGSLFPVESHITCFEYEGELLFIGQCRDITERLSAEHSLRASESRFRRIIQSTPVGMSSPMKRASSSSSTPATARSTATAATSCLTNRS